ncbi:MAG: hypothetical protein MI742_18570 [Desulfobacterales bacterium]|nr:hypothetical protein [Desulfobacterales bacterium]
MKSFYPLLVILCIVGASSTALAQPQGLSDQEMAMVTGQQGIKSQEVPAPNQKNTHQPLHLIPLLFSPAQIQSFHDEGQRQRAFYHMAHTTTQVAQIHKSLFIAPQAVTTILSVPATIGGFFF